MKGTTSKRWTRSQTLRKRLSDAAICEDKATDTPAPPPPKPLSTINRVSNKRAKAQPSRLVSQPVVEPKQTPAPPQPQSEPDFLFEPPLQYTLILNWLDSIGSNRYIRHCRSDSHLQLQPTNDNDHTPVHVTGSAPAMSRTRNFSSHSVAQRILNRSSIYDTNASSGFPHRFGSSVGTAQRGNTLVEQPGYRIHNLASNNISMQKPKEQPPNQITGLINLICQDRDTPTIAQVKALHEIWLNSFATQDMAISEIAVKKYFLYNILPASNTLNTLKCNEGMHMSQHIVPNTSPDYKVSTPVPDVLYGYNAKDIVRGEYTQIMTLVDQVRASDNFLLYPFLVFKFKGDGGSMWVATNQCLGASASCVNIAEDLNYYLSQCKSDKTIKSATFSIATNGTEVRLYISWRQDEIKYYTATVQSFSLQDPDQFIKLYNRIHNILDWGRGQRLEEIRDAVDILLEENRRRDLEAAQSRPPPSSDSASRTRTKRHKKNPNKITKNSGSNLRRSSRLRR